MRTSCGVGSKTVSADPIWGQSEAAAELARKARRDNMRGSFGFGTDAVSLRWSADPVNRWPGADPLQRRLRDVSATGARSQDAVSLADQASSDHEAVIPCDRIAFLIHRQFRRISAIGDGISGTAAGAVPPARSHGGTRYFLAFGVGPVWSATGLTLSEIGRVLCAARLVVCRGSYTGVTIVTVSFGGRAVLAALTMAVGMTAAHTGEAQEGVGFLATSLRYSERMLDRQEDVTNKVAIADRKSVV